MIRVSSALLLAAQLLDATGAFAGSSSVETIVMVRHGEKPGKGLGQLSCQGLNRALALGGVLARSFGKPDAIFAPDPAVQKQDRGVAYDYVRPLATIEPAAIAFGMPVHAGIGVADIATLQAALDDPRLANGVVLVAWEHAQLVILARHLLAAHGGAGNIPDWDARDYDRIDVIRIIRDGSQSRSAFSRQREGLDGMSVTCPGAAPK